MYQPSTPSGDDFPDAGNTRSEIAHPALKVAAWVEGKPLDKAGFIALLSSFAPDIDLIAAREVMAEVELEPALGTFGLAVLRVERMGPLLWDAVGAIRRQLPDTRVFVVADTLRLSSIDDVVSKGVSGLLTTHATGDRLRRALLAVGSRELVFGDEGFVPYRGQGTTKPRLTTRQREVLKLVAEGMRIEEISVRVSASPSTVKRDIRQLHLKLKTRDRAGLAARAIRSGLVL